MFEGYEMEARRMLLVLRRRNCHCCSCRCLHEFKKTALDIYVSARLFLFDLIYRVLNRYQPLPIVLKWVNVDCW